MIDSLEEVAYRSMRHTGRLFNIGIGLAENVAYYTALYSVAEAYAPEQAPVWMAFPFMAASALAFSDGLSRIFFNTPFYKLKTEEPNVSKEISQARLKELTKKKDNSI